jgi:epoxide hydrolase
MGGLGYSRYGAQGGDWGSQVSTALAVQHPDHLIGIHLNMVFAFPDRATAGELTEREREALAALDYHRKWGWGYAIQQSTRPQSLGYGLVDSPAGLLGWIVEKFWAWSDCDGDPANVFTNDEMLDNVMLLLAAWHRGIRGPAVLGELRKTHPGSRLRSGWRIDIPEGDLPPFASVGRATVPRAALLERARQGRSLRCARAAHDIR